MNSLSRFEKLDIHLIAEQLANEIWSIVDKWPLSAKDTIGLQIVRSIDRFGANIAEGAGGGTARSFHYYMQISIGSIYETKYWLSQAENRNLLSKQQSEHLLLFINYLIPKLHAFRTVINTK